MMVKRNTRNERGAWCQWDRCIVRWLICSPTIVECMILFTILFRNINRLILHLVLLASSMGTWLSTIAVSKGKSGTFRRAFPPSVLLGSERSRCGGQTGFTSTSASVGVNLFSSVSVPLVNYFGIEGGLSFKIKSRGSAPRRRSRGASLPYCALAAETLELWSEWGKLRMQFACLPSFRSGWLKKREACSMLSFPTCTSIHSGHFEWRDLSSSSSASGHSWLSPPSMLRGIYVLYNIEKKVLL